MPSEYLKLSEKLVWANENIYLELQTAYNDLTSKVLNVFDHITEVHREIKIIPVIYEDVERSCNVCNFPCSQCTRLGVGNL